ncbi:hypothetical protein EDD70_2373 [Hydrogenoanaerobacterium saccharovorans]|uniref:Uncharacterized protein n=1 Tax=Hydrogenoanaerobacterium saccharovorans TaxID=474960 RepID=A0A1H8D1U7_9FIRM|nr:hypothetical protein [Hydrogenoanaerobacterium saccharovorans]RPF43409.1 hypothetical protein EDD70_2373 [Hydrogenoanaerobacterium saccharovorans]SEN00568.1 hypothetical protein SAMN05216180_2432 [Hydrogenoanaerobacterium saccharovorans]
MEFYKSNKALNKSKKITVIAFILSIILMFAPIMYTVYQNILKSDMLSKLTTLENLYYLSGIAVVPISIMGVIVASLIPKRVAVSQNNATLLSIRLQNYVEIFEYIESLDFEIEYEDVANNNPEKYKILNYKIDKYKYIFSYDIFCLVFDYISCYSHYTSSRRLAISYLKSGDFTNDHYCEYVKRICNYYNLLYTSCDSRNTGLINGIDDLIQNIRLSIPNQDEFKYLVSVKEQILKRNEIYFALMDEFDRLFKQ